MVDLNLIAEQKCSQGADTKATCPKYARVPIDVFVLSAPSVALTKRCTGPKEVISYYLCGHSDAAVDNDNFLGIAVFVQCHSKRYISLLLIPIQRE